MITKIKKVGIVTGLMVVCYVILTIMMPEISTSATSAAAQMDASAYASNYAFAKASNNFMPLVLYFIPGLVGIISIAVILKSGQTQ